MKVLIMTAAIILSSTVAWADINIQYLCESRRYHVDEVWLVEEDVDKYGTKIAHEFEVIMPKLIGKGTETHFFLVQTLKGKPDGQWELIMKTASPNPDGTFSGYITRDWGVSTYRCPKD